MSNPQLAKQIFLEAIELSPQAARDSFVQQKCEGDPDLLARVAELLEAHDQAGNFLGNASLTQAATGSMSAATLKLDDLTGSQIGP